MKKCGSPEAEAPTEPTDETCVPAEGSKGREVPWWGSGKALTYLMFKVIVVSYAVSGVLS